MTDDIVEELREWRNEGHVADHRGYCHYCYVRFPCLWAEALDDIGKAAVEIERLRALLREVASIGPFIGHRETERMILRALGETS